MKKIRNLTCFLLVLFIIRNQLVLGKGVEFTEKTESFFGKSGGVDVMFVIDSSNSMNATDREKFGLEMLKVFNDLSPSKDTRIGFVSYNGQIISYKALSHIDTQGEKNSIRRYIDSISRWGNTDMGLGLKKGYDLVTKDFDEKRQHIIIMISDGDTLSKTAGRTVDDSNRDIEEVIKETKSKNIPIYTVAMGNEEGDYIKTLKKISDSTNGVSYTLTDPRNLIEVYDDILNKHFNLEIIPFASIKASGESQEITLDLPNEYVKEANIIFLSNSSIKGTQVYSESANVDFYNSKDYYSVKIKDPINERIKIVFKGKSQEIIKMYMLLSYDLNYEVEFENTKSKVEPIVGNVYFLNEEDNKRIEDLELFNSLKWKIVIENKLNGKEDFVEPIVSKDGYRFSYDFNEKGEYSLKMLFFGDSVYFKTDEIPIIIENQAPQGNFEEKLELIKTGRIYEYDLREYFYDTDEDTLSYGIKLSDDKKLSVSIEEGVLKLKPISLGESELKIIITDSDGAEIKKNITIKNISIFEGYKEIFIIIIVILVLIVILLIISFTKKRLETKVRESFKGKINMYFLNLKEEYSEIPPMFFMLYKLNPKKRISLNDLIKEKNINLDFKELNKIYFHASLDKNIKFSHNTNCTIMIGQELVCKGKEYVIENGNKIFIALEDNITEIEIRYKKSDRNECED